MHLVWCVLQKELLGEEGKTNKLHVIHCTDHVLVRTFKNCHQTKNCWVELNLFVVVC